MPDFTTEIDIDPYDYVSECSKREIRELIEVLIEDGHLSLTALPVVKSKDRNLLDDEWDEVVIKLQSKRLVMSDEDEQMIREISKKY
jgi:hypothetical protein